MVDRPDVSELAAAIDRLAEDANLQEELVRKALAFVRTGATAECGQPSSGVRFASPREKPLPT